MSDPAVEDALWEVVRRNRGGVLATVGPDGMPHLSNVNYLAETEERLVLLTTITTRVKGRNLLRDPRAAVHVQEDDWFAYAVAQGTATIAVAEEPGDPATDGLHEIFTAFRGAQHRPEFDVEMIAAGRMIVRLSVDRLYGLAPKDSAKTRTEGAQ